MLPTTSYNFVVHINQSFAVSIVIVKTNLQDELFKKDVGQIFPDNTTDRKTRKRTPLCPPYKFLGMRHMFGDNTKDSNAMLGG